MDLNGDATRFETDDCLSYAPPKHSLEMVSLPVAYIDSQAEVDPYGFPIFDGNLDSAAFSWPEPFMATFSSPSPLYWPTSGIIAPFEDTAAYTFPSFQQYDVRSQGQKILPRDGVNIGPPDPTTPYDFFLQQNISSQTQLELSPLNQQVNLQQPAQCKTNKRTRKARNMPATRWASHENRIRQLYVSEAKSFKEVRPLPL